MSERLNMSMNVCGGSALCWVCEHVTSLPEGPCTSFHIAKDLDGNPVLGHPQNPVQNSWGWGCGGNGSHGR